jgi:hypothetical protein
MHGPATGNVDFGSPTDRLFIERTEFLKVSLSGISLEKAERSGVLFEYQPKHYRTQNLKSIIAGGSPPAWTPAKA